MRITIQIHGDQVTGSPVQPVQPVQPGATDAGALQPTAAAPAAAPGLMGPPPEVLTAAAAIGAQSAGPAPAELRAMGAMGTAGTMGAMQQMPQPMGAPMPFTGSASAVAGPSDQSAGAAPGTSLEAPAQVIAEESQ